MTAPSKNVARPPLCVYALAREQVPEERASEVVVDRRHDFPNPRCSTADDEVADSVREIGGRLIGNTYTRPPRGGGVEAWNRTCDECDVAGTRGGHR